MTASPSSAVGTHGPARATAASRLVIDAPTRMFHWLFASTFVIAYATGDSEHWRLLHVTSGYSFAGLLGFRVLYGIFGPRQARLRLLWRRIAGAPAWLRSLAAARSVAAINGRQGQNLAVALAIVSMLALALPLALSGYVAYAGWGDGWAGDAIEEVHEFFGNAILGAVLAHVALIAALSVVRRPNQALPMLTGRVPGTGPHLVPKDRAWLAALLLGAVAIFGAWQWQLAERAALPSHEAAASPAGMPRAAGREAGEDTDDD